MGTQVTQLDIGMSVDTSGPTLQKGEITYVPSAPLWPFGFPRYENETLIWTIQTHVDGFSVDINNAGEQVLELFWNEGRWRSSFQEAWSEFLVLEQYVGRLVDRKHSAATDPSTPFAPVSWSLEPGEQEYFAFRAAIGNSPKNPGGLLFGISNADIVAGSFDQAIANWIELELPVANSKNRTTYLFRLILNDAASRVSYY